MDAPVPNQRQTLCMTHCAVFATAAPTRMPTVRATASCFCRSTSISCLRCYRNLPLRTSAVNISFSCLWPKCRRRARESARVEEANLACTMAAGLSLYDKEISAVWKQKRRLYECPAATGV